MDKVTNGLRLSRAKCAQLTDKSIKEFHIVSGGVDFPMTSLSGGNQQKAVIAKWFNTDPKILLMDEPTAGVDIGAKTEIIETIRKFSKLGKSVILVSSELSELLAICDRILILEKGQIKKELRREEIKSEEALQYEIQH